jgi:hypothetical protein
MLTTPKINKNKEIPTNTSPKTITSKVQKDQLIKVEQNSYQDLRQSRNHIIKEELEKLDANSLQASKMKPTVTPAKPDGPMGTFTARNIPGSEK